MFIKVTQRASGEDYRPQINCTIWLLTAISAIFLVLRVYCKFLRRRGLWRDDHILIASWVRAWWPIAPFYQRTKGDFQLS